MHPLMQPWRFLLGTWEGTGRGLWPSTSPLRYRERLAFTEDGRPFICYQQATSAEDGRPLHTESGYLRLLPGGSAELVVTQPTGIVEIHHGTRQGSHVQFRSELVAHTPTALNVTGVARSVQVDGDQYRYKVWIAMNGEPLAPHLEGLLERQLASSAPAATVEPGPG